MTSSRRIPELPTVVGQVGFGDHRFFGHKIVGDLLGKMGIAEIVWLSIAGKLPTADQVQVLGDCAVIAASADPRGWPFKVARLAASYGTPAQGLAAAFAAGPGSNFGPERFSRAAEIIQALRSRTRDDDPASLRDALADVLRGGTEPFGVPYRNHDERLEGLRRQVHARGRETAPYWSIAERAIELARSEHQLEPHFSFGVAAYALDAGMGVREVHLLGAWLIVPGLLANSAESADQCADVLRRLPSDCVDYRGPAPRMSPRAARAGT
jgi:hypothetical protein